MPVAYGAHRREVSRHGGDAAGGGADDRLGHEGDHPAGSDALELRLQLGRQARRVLRVALLRLLAMIREAGGDVAEAGGQDRLVRRAAGDVAAGRHRAEQVAVVALPARDEVGAAFLAALDVVLAGHLQRGLHRL